MAPALSKYQKVGVSIAILSAVEDEKKKRKRRIWMKRWLKERKRLSHINLIDLFDFEELNTFLRMNLNTFNELLEMVRPFITKQDTVMREAVSAEERLLVTLRYLATGRELNDLSTSSLVSPQLLSEIIFETCWAIYRVLKETIKMPSNEEEWIATAKLFEQRWQFPNCVGCMDGKHILIEKPPNSGSLYYNYKGTFSVVLFAVVNANYEFMYVHTGSNGSMSDGGIIKETKFYKKLMDKQLHLPESFSLPSTDVSVPYVFLGDSAFALQRHIMKPFPVKNISRSKRIFNYRLCRARRIVENAFGILASRFRVFRHPINLNLETVDAITLASCALHNFLRKRSKTYLTPSSVDNEDLRRLRFTKGSWRLTGDELTPLARTSTTQSNDGQRVRNILTDYFNSAGRVHFQDVMVDRIPN